MGCLIGLLAAVVLLGGAMWLTFGLVGFFLTLLVAGALGALADAVVPGRLPGGFLGAILAGIAGGFVGNLVLRLVGLAGVGPSLFGVDIIPTFVGAVVIAAGIEVFSRTTTGRRAMR